MRFDPTKSQPAERPSSRGMSARRKGKPEPVASAGRELLWSWSGARDGERGIHGNCRGTQVLANWVDLSGLADSRVRLFEVQNKIRPAPRPAPHAPWGVAKSPQVILPLDVEGRRSEVCAYSLLHPVRSAGK